MKYFLVTNDIIDVNSEGIPTWTDEPLWLRNEISTWKEKYGCGGRCWATEDARKSLIVSPDEELLSKSNNDLEELSYEQFLEYKELAFPPRIIQREGEPDEVVIISVEDIHRTYWGFAANHTGTITSDQTWTVADNDHFLTGGVTIGANVVLTWEPGVRVFTSTASGIALTAGTSGTTTLYAVGTPDLPILWGKTTAGMGGYTAISALPNNCAVNVQYARIESAATFLSHGNPTNATVTLNNIYTRDSTTFFATFGDSFYGNVTLNNCYFDRSGTNGSSNAVVSTGIGNISAGTITFNDCFFHSPINLRGWVLSGAGHTINYNNCYFKTSSIAAGVTTTPNYTYNFDSCYFHNMIIFSAGSIATNPVTISNSIITKVGYSVPATSVNTNTFTNCDIIDGAGAILYAVNNLNLTGGNIVTMSGCYTAAFRTADYLYTGTALQVAGTIAISGERSTPNFPFTPTSVTASSVTSSSVTIGWSAGFRTRNRIRYGTTPGTYDMTAELFGTWSNWDGKGAMTKDPVFVLSNLKSGTTYYYTAQSYNSIFDEWISSAEGTFTTTADGGTGIQPSYGYIG
jgi:hypothetical protein